MPTTLVVGSSSGIGLSVVNQLLPSTSVIGISRSPFHLQSTNYSHLVCDISDSSSFLSLLSSIDLSIINNFVVCAGTNIVQNLNSISLDDAQYLFSVNYFPSLILLSELSKLPPASRGVVLVGSIWSRLGLPGRSVYGSTKSALRGLLVHASSELSPSGTLVNLVSPGFTRTPLTAKTLSDPLLSSVLNRGFSTDLQDPNGVAEAIISLLRPNNSIVTGQELFVDSGIVSHA